MRTDQFFFVFFFVFCFFFEVAGAMCDLVNAIKKTVQDRSSQCKMRGTIRVA